ncbi:MAG: hypothetical protein ACR2QO_10975 [Acidimicrobiales bacterium]
MNWTSRLPRASLRGVAGATRPIRAVLVSNDTANDETNDETNNDPPQIDDPTTRRGATPAEFARRAIEEARLQQVDLAEVRSDRAAGRPFIGGDNGATLTVTPSASWYSYPSARPGQISTSLAADDGRYGVVLCLDAMERYPEPLPLMMELDRILAPGGQLFLVAPLIVPEPAMGSSIGASDRRRYGLNYLLDMAALKIGYLEPVDRSSGYAVIARKPVDGPPQRRRRSDRA